MAPAFVRQIVCVAPGAASAVADGPQAVAARLLGAAQRPVPARAAAAPVEEGDAAFSAGVLAYAARVLGGFPF